jgi:hypothetical protein
MDRTTKRTRRYLDYLIYLFMMDHLIAPLARAALVLDRTSWIWPRVPGKRQNDNLVVYRFEST